ncbi:uncharacterized protein PRCAT00002524001 [Priceomyces carsonii]|uniref:uncharacterized protein n=1 Tax=Priceomyces carsonii TaxID=28549 RepID=UPI002ED78CC7|nr:unnamed protein product [Priceomyces carsonii]
MAEVEKNVVNEEIREDDSGSYHPQKDYLGNLTKRLLNDCIRSPWGQVCVIAFVCFCCPGMYNALTGMGGSGQVDPTAAANASVALLSVGAVTGVFLAGPLVSLIGPRNSIMMGGWTYALYSGSLFNFNHRLNSAFVIASGALLGLGANLLWIPQGMIMTTYVKERHRGRAIALFWVIFNLGGGIGSLASLGINYYSVEATVTDSTYIAYIVIMLFGWVFGSLLICDVTQLNEKFSGQRVSKVKQQHGEAFSFSKIKDTALFTFSVLSDWKLLCLIPMFFYANVFYSYQQNSVNGMTFNVRTRSLNSALYWMSQMIGGIVIGGFLDLHKISRRRRAIFGWIQLLVVGMVIWGGGLKFQLWNDKRTAKGLIQDIDFKDSNYIGPMFLYIFYGGYDALWQGYCYWLIGLKSKSPAVGGVIVGCYKTMQCVGGAMAWRINATGVSPMKQLAMNWGLTGGALLIALPSILLFVSNEREDIDIEKDSGVDQNSGESTETNKV